MKVKSFSKNNQLFVYALLFLIFLLAIFITAWVCDDAFITFRTIDNFTLGYGLVWNINERVQAYTHPLWMFVLTAFYILTKDLYYTSIFLSIAISLVVFYLIIARISVSLNNSLISGIILIFSKAFIDFSTSGLENPLSHLILALFFMSCFYMQSSHSKLLSLTFLTSLCTVNRFDTIILIAPILVSEYFSLKTPKKIAMIIIGFVPIFLWGLFSIIYYGFLFPNTAYAKLNTNIPKSELIGQGFYYLADSLLMDPLTFFTITAVIIISLVKRRKDIVLIASGVGLYIIYVVYIGGDFMSGRFLSAPLFCSVVIISRIEIQSIKQVVTYVTLIIVLGFLSPRPNFLSTSNYSLGPKIIHGFRFGPKIIGMKNGITDERYWYYENTGLLNNIYEKKLFNHPWVKHGLELRRNRVKLVVKSTTGLLGFFANKDVHIIDQYALSDAFLSRLPSTEYWLIGKEKPKEEKFWRIGHFARKIPEGYIETIQTGSNKILNPSLSKFYDRLSIITKGDLFSWSRFIEIWNFNTGKYNFLLDEYNRTIL